MTNHHHHHQTPDFETIKELAQRLQSIHKEIDRGAEQSNQLIDRSREIKNMCTNAQKAGYDIPMERLIEFNKEIDQIHEEAKILKAREKEFWIKVHGIIDEIVKIADQQQQQQQQQTYSPNSKND